jgi:ketosteroid isomerase-like protein
MKTIQHFVVGAVAAVLFAACTPPANTPTNTNANTANANANVAAAKPAAPTVEALTALETKATEAWKNKDTKFWDTFLADNFVGFGADGKRYGKADVAKMMAEDKCEVKSYSFSDQHVTPAGADAAIITMKVTTDYTCNGKPGPSPVISASVYERSGDDWKAAYHNEVPVVDPKNMKAGEPKPAAPMAKTTASPAAAATADALTDSLMAIEKSGWEAWKARDAKKLSDMTGSDLAYVDFMGNFASNKADTIKAWTEAKCEIKNFALSDGKSTMITKDAAILTFKGVPEGTCDGNPLKAIWGTSIYVKDGDTWKPVYVFETPA